MPFSIVLARQIVSASVAAVPSGWVKDNYLFWPRIANLEEAETLRRNELSVPGANWRRQQCIVRVQGIASFAEASLIEDVYVNELEDELRYKDVFRLVRENNILKEEIRKLKLENQSISNQHMETGRKFDIVQVQLSRIINLVNSIGCKRTLGENGVANLPMKKIKQ